MDSGPSPVPPESGRDDRPSRPMLAVIVVLGLVLVIALGVMILKFS